VPIKIGVFDSGVGGLSVSNAVQKAIPDCVVILREDKKNLPYGNKSPEQLLTLVVPILKEMEEEGCETIVIACNTVTTTIIEELRKVIKIPLIGMEPMVKPAAELTKSSVIAVFATPATLKSARYNWLKSEYAPGVTVIEPDCNTWSAMIEHNQVNENLIRHNVETALKSHADVIVLGCSHYHWIEDIVKKYAEGQAEVLQPERPIIARLKQVLGLQP
jgi:glutamate racemase